SGCVDLIYDIAPLASLGGRLVLVFRARPHIDDLLEKNNITKCFSNEIRVTDAAVLPWVLQAVGGLQIHYEAHLSTSLVSTPMGGARISTVSGNLITAKPMGIVDGIDYGYTGEIRHIDTASIESHLAHGHIVLLSCLGYSPSGETFNLVSQDVAGATAAALGADKLVLMHTGPALH